MDIFSFIVLNEKYNTLIYRGRYKGFRYIRNITVFKHLDRLKYFQRLFTTSIGSVIGYLIILGFEPNEIIIQCIQKNYFQKVERFQILRGIAGNGFLDFKLFETILNDFTFQKLEKFPTFEELYNYNPINLQVITYNYSKNREEVLSKETTPDLSLLDALRMSSNIPFIFGHFQYKDDYYFDGFISSNFPIHLIKKEEDISLGICCLRNNWKEDKG